MDSDSLEHPHFFDFVDFVDFPFNLGQLLGQLGPHRRIGKFHFLDLERAHGAGANDNVTGHGLFACGSRQFDGRRRKDQCADDIRDNGNRDRLAIGIVWIVLVPSEMLGVSSGLGYFILDARDRLDYTELLSIILIIGFIGFVLDRLVVSLQKRIAI